MAAPFNLKDHGITVGEIRRNLPPSALYEHAIRYEKDASIAESGALVAYSGVKTGRSPKDKRIVKHPDSEADVWWGAVNIPIQPPTFAINRERARDYLNICDRIYCFDGFAGWDSSNQGTRHLFAALPRAVHAHHAYTAHEAAVGRIRQARLRHLQCRLIPGQQSDRGHGFKDEC